MDEKLIKREIRRELGTAIVSERHLNADVIRERTLRIFETRRRQSRYQIDDAQKDQIINSLCDDFLGWGPLQHLMEDKEISEIMVNGPFKVYMEKEGKKTLTDITFDDEAHLRYIIEKMLAPSARRLDESLPYVDFSLDDGSRVNVIIPPLAIGGAMMTIRKFLRTIEKVEDLVSLGTIDERMAEFLTACVKAKLNILFSGATGSGKTTTVEVLSSYIDSSERIVTIEDALELSLRQDHVVRLLTKPPNIEGKGEVTIRDLFRNTLRMRPTRIILGEIRGEEAMDYLQALNSGHRGCLAVIHASRPSDAMGRLETMSLYAGLNIPVWGIRRQISSGLNLIVQHDQLIDGSRKINYISEVGELSDNAIVLRDVFRYEAEEVTEEGKLKGKFKCLGKPDFFTIFKKKGISINENIFKPDVSEKGREFLIK
ncbi:MAG: CpaF family protein [Candidatus Omnitrophota bacterium]|nr:MAG: CpaF family protein [Candidatus Omnitrophota bacterium]